MSYQEEPQQPDWHDDAGAWHAFSLEQQQYQEELSNNHRKQKMSLIVKGGNSADFEPAPAGMQLARCFRIVDLGTQESTYMGEVKHSHVILLSWELPNATMTDGRPFTVSRRFTASLGQKARLRAVLESWRGRKFSPAELDGFDLKNILGKTCLLNIIHSPSKDGTKMYANVDTVNPVVQGMPIPHSINEQLFFSLTDFDRATFEKLGKNIQESIAKSPEYQSLGGGFQESSASQAPAASDDDQDDDIPF